MCLPDFACLPACLQSDSSELFAQTLLYSQRRPGNLDRVSYQGAQEVLINPIVVSHALEVIADVAAKVGRVIRVDSYQNAVGN